MPGQNYVLLERIELNATASSVTFSNIPQTGYTDLKVVISARNTSGGEDNISMKINNLTSSIYSQKAVESNGSSASSFSQSGVNTAVRVGVINGATDTASIFSSTEVYIPNYAGSQIKTASCETTPENNATTAYMNMIAYLVSTTDAITSLTFNTPASFAANSTFSLYGVANASATPAIAPKADGGNIIATDGTYWYHAFLSNGTFTPQTNLTCDILQIAGGGGGGGGGSTWATGGGGGAGGLLAFTSQSLTATSYALTVGAAGAGGVGYATSGSNGSNSQFASLTASVGGGKGGGWTQVTSTGGSGGGGSGYTSVSGNETGAAGTSGQGSSGGTGTSSLDTNSRGGGGGGATGAGTNGNTGLGGAGGAGSSSYSAWATATNTGSSGNYAGGGAGGCGGTGGTGAAGGGNGGSGNVSGTNAVANTGSGGGGAGAAGSGGATNGGNGSSGIIIVRYLAA